MTLMTSTGKKAHVVKRPTKSKSSVRKARANPRVNRTKTPSKTASRKPTSRASSHQTGEATYIFECTRTGCGYRIPREEKAEQGSLRFDLKCPKCHNKEFKCLGKGDLPESLELPVPTTNIDFDNIRPVDLGSN